MHEIYMKRALELARRGAGFVNPNPMVGAVIVKDGRIIGEGWHERYGGFHAERNALLRATEDVAGADMYVTLEPCSHYGKTPPCAEAVIEHKIKRVFTAMTDPNPLVRGRGLKLLKDAGIEVTSGILEKESRRLNEIFLKYITTKEPFVLMKWAMTLDGKIAAHTGDSRWITGPDARRNVHLTRHKIMGIMAGIGTVLADDPALTTRLEDAGFEPLDPVRIICDTHLRIPLEAQALHVESSAGVIIATGPECDPEKEAQLKALGAQVLRVPLRGGFLDLNALMRALGQQGIDSVLLEGGGQLNFSALKTGIVDKVEAYIAPKIIGGRDAKTPVEGSGFARMAEALPFSVDSISQLGPDILLNCYPKQDWK